MRRLIGIPMNPSAPALAGVPMPTLTATAVSASEIDLVANYVGPPALLNYVFSRGTVGSAQFLTVIASQASPNYADTNLSAGTTYYYAVSVVTNESPARVNGSRVQSATTQAAAALPAQVTGLTASASAQEIDLSWTAVATATQYVLYRSTTANGTYTLIGGTQGATTYADTGLAANTPYYYKVAAYNPQGYGTASAVLSTQTTVGKPSVVLNVVATAADGQVTVTFNAPASDGGSAINGYTASANGGPTVGSLGATPKPITLSATNGVVTTVTVHAYNNVGTGPNGTSNAVTPQASGQTRADRIMTYLNGLAAAKKVLSGQATIYSGDSVAAGQAIFEAVQTKTGKLPAIYGTNLNFNANPNNQGDASGATTIPTSLKNAATQWARNGFVIVQPDLGNPISNNASGAGMDGGSRDNSQMSAANFAQLATAGTTLNNNWHKQLDYHAGVISQATANGNVLLYKFFIELNGGWNWYGGQDGPTFIKLWIDTYNYLIYTKGLKGKILVVFNVNAYANDWINYYPGDPYVDILSYDIYTDNVTNFVSSAKSNSMHSTMVGYKKPILLGEWGRPGNPANTYSYDNMDVLNGISQSLPGLIGFNQWDQGSEIIHQNNPTQLMTDSRIITVTDLPAGLNN